MSKPMDWAFLDPVFMMFPMSRMISRILANFLDFRTSSQAAVAATIWGLQSCTSSGYLCWNMSDFSLGTSLLMPGLDQVWSLTQFPSVGFLQSRISVKKWGSKYTIKFASWGIGTSTPSVTNLTASLISEVPQTMYETKLRALEWHCVCSQNPSRVHEKHMTVAGRNKREFPSKKGPLIRPTGNQWFFTKSELQKK